MNPTKRMIDGSEEKKKKLLEKIASLKTKVNLSHPIVAQRYEKWQKKSQRMDQSLERSLETLEAIISYQDKRK